MSARHFLTRGLLAGLLAGLVAFVVAYVAGEPSLNAALALEGAGPPSAEPGQGHSHPAPAGDEVVEVPRSLQSTVGLLTGTVVAGVTLGGLVGVLSALALGRFGALGPRATTLGVAGAGFVASYLVPFSTYPPNPPAVGSADTIGERTAAYFVLVAISILALAAAVIVGRSLRPRIGGWYASLLAIAAYLVLTVSAAGLLPSYTEVPAGFPADILYDFRLASLATQLALWSVLGVALAELVHRLVTGAADREVEHARR